VVTPTYGTRSATALALGPGRVARFFAAEGRPGTVPWTDHLAHFSEPATANEASP
jgi:hypothetical protein